MKPSAQTYKFTPATLPEVYAPREALMRTFNALADVRNIMVSAPAGCGKTVSTLLWLRQSARKVLWISLDEYDNAPSIFYRLLCTAVASAYPHNARVAAISTSPDFTASPIEHTALLLSMLEASEQSYALVLDDLHLITNEEIRRSLPFMLRRLPHNFVALLLTRSAPGDGFVDLIEKKEVAVLDMSALTFSADEIWAYYNKTGHTLTKTEAQETYSFTGGWAFGVNALRTNDGNRENLHGMPPVDRYMERQICAHWRDDQRTFMLQISIADEITIDLANRLTGREDSRAMLDDLCASGAFLLRQGDDRYSCHHLFLEFLRTQLPESGLDLAALNRTAAEYYLEAQRHLTARRYAVRSRDVKTVVQSFHGFSQYSNPSLEEYVTFSEVFNRDTMPTEICEAYPFLYTSHMYVAYLNGNADASAYYLDKLRAHLPLIAQRYPQILELVILEFSLDHRFSFSQLMENFSALPAISARNKGQQGFSLTLQMPFLHRSNRDYHEFADPAVLNQLSENFGAMLREKYNIVTVCLRSGLLLEQGETDRALDFAKQALALAKETKSAEIVFATHMHLAAAYDAKDNHMLLTDVLERTDAYIRDSSAEYLRHNYMAFCARIQMADCNQQVASHWLENYFVTDSENVPLYKVYQAFTTVRAYIVLGQTNKALDLLEKITCLVTNFGRLLDLAEVQTLKACMLWVMQKQTEATALLEETLLSLQAYHFVRVVANEGASVLPILKRIISKTQAETYEGTLERSFVNQVHMAAYAAAKRHTGITSGLQIKPLKLSKQQQKVLSYLAQGLKNTDIVTETGLSIHTIKTHTRIAYEKLGVTNVMDAVLKARELGLVE